MTNILTPAEATTAQADKYIMPATMEEMEHAVLTLGRDVATPIFDWREAGARLILMSTDYNPAAGSRNTVVGQWLVEAQEADPVRVTRLDAVRFHRKYLPDAEEKGLFVPRPIEGCEAIISDTIALNSSLVLSGLCRQTKKLQSPAMYAQTGPIRSIRYLS